MWLWVVMRGYRWLYRVKMDKGYRWLYRVIGSYAGLYEGLITRFG